MHKAYSDNDNLTADISKVVLKSINQYGKKNKKYLANQVESEVNKLVKGVDVEGNIDSLISDTIKEVDVAHDVNLVSKLNDLNKQYDEMTYGTKAIYQKIPGRSRNAFNKMYDQATDMINKGELTIDQAVRSVTKNYKPTIKYKNGANVPMNSYLRMLYKTNQGNVAELRTNQIAEVLGTDVFEYSSHSEPRESCSKIEGKLVAYGDHEKIELRNGQMSEVLNINDYGYGEASGPRGINCTHFMFAFTGYKRGQTKDVIDSMANAPGVYKAPKQSGWSKTNNVKITDADVEAVFDTTKANIKYIKETLNDPIFDDGVRVMLKQMSGFKEYNPAWKNITFKRLKNKNSHYTLGGELIMDKADGKFTLVHELGHAFEDYSFNKRGQTSDFFMDRDIVKLKKQSYHDFEDLVDEISSRRKELIEEYLETKNRKKIKINSNIEKAMEARYAYDKEYSEIKRQMEVLEGEIDILSTKYIESNLSDEKILAQGVAKNDEYEALQERLVEVDEASSAKAREIDKLEKDKEAIEEDFRNDIENEAEIQQIEMITDTIDALTEGYVYDNGHGAGHGANYYAGSYQKKFAEVYTHTVSIININDPKYIAYFKEALGEEQFNAMVEHAKKDNEYLGEWKYD